MSGFRVSPSESDWCVFSSADSLHRCLATRREEIDCKKKKCREIIPTTAMEKLTRMQCSNNKQVSTLMTPFEGALLLWFSSLYQLKETAEGSVNYIQMNIFFYVYSLVNMKEEPQRAHQLICNVLFIPYNKLSVKTSSCFVLNVPANSFLYR